MLIELLLSDHGKSLRDKRILELGSGTGLAGLCAAALGCHVLLTDVPSVTKSVLVPNISLNKRQHPHYRPPTVHPIPPVSRVHEHEHAPQAAESPRTAPELQGAGRDNTIDYTAHGVSAHIHSTQDTTIHAQTSTELCEGQPQEPGTAQAQQSTIITQTTEQQQHKANCESADHALHAVNYIETNAADSPGVVSSSSCFAEQSALRDSRIAHDSCSICESRCPSQADTESPSLAGITLECSNSYDVAGKGGPWLNCTAVGEGSASACALDWTVPIEQQVLCDADGRSNDPREAEAIIACEVIWLKELVEPYVSTVLAIMRGPRRPSCYMSYTHRGTATSTVFANEDDVMGAFRRHGCTIRDLGMNSRTSDGEEVVAWMITLA